LFEKQIGIGIDAVIFYWSGECRENDLFQIIIYLKAIHMLWSYYNILHCNEQSTPILKIK